MSERDIEFLEGFEPTYGGGLSNASVAIKHQQYDLVTCARWAIEMAARWGATAAMPDGEDSAGRSKMRLQTPDEVSARACEIATLLWVQCEKRGWLVPVPKPIKRDRARHE